MNGFEATRFVVTEYHQGRRRDIARHAAYLRCMLLRATTLPSLVVFNRLMRQERLRFLTRAEERKGGLDDAVEQEGEIDKEHKAEDLEPLKCLPAEAERHDPDE